MLRIENIIKMKKKLLYVLIACLFTINIAFGQEGDTRLNIEPREVIAGESLKLVYQPGGGPLEGMSELAGIAYMYNFYRWEVVNISFTKEKEGWRAVVEIPENCGFIAFKFLSEIWRPIAVDNNDNKGFMYIVKDKQGQVVPGGNLAWGIFRMPSLGQGVKDYFSQGYEEISDEAMNMWLEREVQMNNRYCRRFFGVMEAFLKKKYGINCKPGVEHLLRTFEKESNLTEEEYMAMRDSYREVKNDEKADSLEQLILQKYPHGSLARVHAASELRKLSGDELGAAMDKFRKDFPIAEWYKHPDEQGYVYRNIYRGLSEHYFQTGDYAKLDEILQEMNMAMLVVFYRKQIEFTVRKKTDIPTEMYVDVSKKVVDQLVNKVKDKSYMDGLRYSPAQADAIAEEYLDYCLSVHAQIAWKCGRYEEAVATKNLREGEHRYRYYPDGNEAYLLSLEKLGRHEEAVEALKGMARTSMMTPSIYDKLKAYYESLPKGKKKRTKTFEAWVESLKSPEQVARIKAKLQEKMVDTPYKPFVLEAHDGGEVDFGQFGDDIVVLDFWALWCGPCIEALPGMQMAVNRYANDPDVKFYFILTQDEPRKETIDMLWERDHLENMPVLYDKNREGGKKGRNAAFYALKSGPTGIPFKVILKNGKIRYRSEGYGGSASGLMDEISYVIEMLKTEK